MTGAWSSRSVYSGSPAALCVRRQDRPAADFATITTPVPPDAMLAGTRTQSAAVA